MILMLQRFLLLTVNSGAGQGYDENGNPQDTVSGGMVLTGIENKYLYPSISGDAVTGGMVLTGIENKYLYPSISGDAVTGGMALTGITMEEV